MGIIPKLTPDGTPHRPKHTLNQAHQFDPRITDGEPGICLTTVVYDERDTVMHVINAILERETSEAPPTDQNDRLCIHRQLTARCEPRRVRPLLDAALAGIARMWDVQISYPKTIGTEVARWHLPGYIGIHIITLTDMGDETAIEWVHEANAPAGSPLHWVLPGMRPEYRLVPPALPPRSVEASPAPVELPPPAAVPAPESYEDQVAADYVSNYARERKQKLAKSKEHWLRTRGYAGTARTLDRWVSDYCKRKGIPRPRLRE